MKNIIQKSIVLSRLILLLFFSAGGPTIPVIAQSISVQQISPNVQNTVGGTTPLVNNVQITYSVGQQGAAPNATWRNGNLMVTQAFEQNIKPEPPVAPPSQTACSDTPYTFTFSNIQAGKGANQVEWALNRSFDSTHIVSNGGGIVVTVSPGHTDTIWMRSMDSTDKEKSLMAYATAKVPGILGAPVFNDTVLVQGDSMRIQASDSNYISLKYNVIDGGAIIDSNTGWLKSITDTLITVRATAVSSENCDTSFADHILKSDPVNTFDFLPNEYCTNGTGEITATITFPSLPVGTVIYYGWATDPTNSSNIPLNEPYSITVTSTSETSATVTLTGLSTGNYIFGANYLITITVPGQPTEQVIWGISVQTSIIYACCGGSIAGGSLTFGDIKTSELVALDYLPISHPTIGAYSGYYSLSLGNTPIAFNGKLTVDNNFMFAECYNMEFGPGTQIEVEDGKNLDLINDFLFPCDTMWKGITVDGAEPHLPGGWLTCGGTTIKGAQYAVQGFSGSILCLQKNIFWNNFIDCYFVGPGAPTFQSHLHLDQPPFAGNEFLANGDLVPNYSNMVNSSSFMGSGDALQPTATLMNNGWPWAGIFAEGITNLAQVGQTTTLTVGAQRKGWTNIFYGLANGIAAYNSNVICYNDSFVLIRNGFSPDYGYSYYNSGAGFNWNYGIPAYGNGILSVMFNPSPNPFLHEPSPMVSLNVYGQYPTSLYNTFTDCYNGIVTYGLNSVSITKNLFDEVVYTGFGNVGIDVQNGIADPSITVNENNMNLSGVGIEALYNDPVGTASVSHNHITVSNSATNIGAGIGAIEGGMAPINSANYNNNIITGNNAIIAGMSFNKLENAICSENTITLNNPEAAFNGILFTSMVNVIDRYNTVSSNSGTVQNTWLNFFPRAIFVQSSTGTLPNFSVHQCNTMRNIYTDMRFIGNCSNTLVEGNNFNMSAGDKSTYGLYYDYSSLVTPAQINTGNHWYGTFGALPNGAAAENDYAITVAQATQTEYQVSTNIGSLYPNPIFTNNPPVTNADWFPYVLGTVDYTCPPPPVAPVKGLTLAQRYLIDDSVMHSPFNAPLSWVDGKFLYIQLMNDTAELDSGADVRAFYAAKAGGATGAIVRLEQLEQTALQPDSLTALLLAAVQDSMAGIQLTLMNLDSIRGALADSTAWARDSAESVALAAQIDSATRVGIYGTDTSLWYSIDSFISTMMQSTPDSNTVSAMDSQIAVWYSVYAGYNTIADSLVRLIDSTRRSRAVVAADSAAAIVTAVDIEEYYKEAHSIYLNTIAQDTTFDRAQISTLHALANMCPALGGEAVFMARGMLALVNGPLLYNDDSLCTAIPDSLRTMWVTVPPDSASKDTSKAKQNITVNLYPNPADDYAILQLSEDVTPLQLEIVNSQGQLVVNQPISTAGGFYTINTSGFAEGLYSTSLYSDGDKLFSEKLSIFR